MNFIKALFVGLVLLVVLGYLALGFMTEPNAHTTLWDIIGVMMLAAAICFGVLQATSVMNYGPSLEFAFPILLCFVGGSFFIIVG